MKPDTTHRKENPIAERAFPIILNYLKDLPEGRLLDIGTGSGHLANRFHNMGCTVESCDARNINQYKHIKWSQVDLNNGNLPYKDESFDYVLFIEVMEHLENPRRIIREAARVMKKGAYGVFSTPHIESLPQRLYFLLTGNFLHFPFPAKQYGHRSPMSLHMIRDEFSRAGLEIKEIKYDRGWIPLLRITLPQGYWFGDLMFMKVRKIA